VGLVGTLSRNSPSICVFHRAGFPLFLGQVFVFSSEFERLKSAQRTPHGSFLSSPACAPPAVAREPPSPFPGDHPHFSQSGALLTLQAVIAEVVMGVGSGESLRRGGRGSHPQFADPVVRDSVRELRVFEQSGAYVGRPLVPMRAAESFLGSCRPASARKFFFYLRKGDFLSFFLQRMPTFRQRRYFFPHLFVLKATNSPPHFIDSCLEFTCCPRSSRMPPLLKSF